MLKQKNKTAPLGAVAFWLLFAGGNAVSQTAVPPGDQLSFTSLHDSPAFPDENIRLRDMYSKHYRLPGGAMQAYISGGPVHYLDEAGRWQDIDPQPRPSVHSAFALENTTNVLQSHYPASITDASGIRIAAGGHHIRLGIDLALEAVDASGNVVALLEQAAATTVASRGQVVKYDQVFSNASYEFEIGNGLVKNNLVLDALPQGIPVQTAFLALTETVVLPGDCHFETAAGPVEGEMLINGPIYIADGRGRGTMHIPAPEVYELAGAMEQMHLPGDATGTYKAVKLAPGVYRLSTLVPMMWLNDQNRNFPVVIDPTVTLNGNWGGYMRDDGGVFQGNPWQYVTAAYQYAGVEIRGFLQWDISSVPNNALVINTEANLYLNTSLSTASDTVRINDITGNFAPYSSWNLAAFTDFGDGNYANLPCSTQNTSCGWLDLGSDADADVAGNLSIDKFQIGISQGANGVALKEFTSNLSQLRVEYILCTGQVNATATASTNGFGYQVDCYGDSTGSITASATNGSSSYTYVWSGPGGYYDTIQNPTGLAAGTYTLMVYSGLTCPDTVEVTLTQPEELHILADSLSTYTGGYNVACHGENSGNIDISVTGSTGYTYSWAGPGGFSATTQDVGSLYAGTYYLTVTEGNSSCTVTDSFTLTEPALAVATSIVNTQDAYCASDSNGSAQAGATGGTTPYTYLWSDDAAQTTAAATGLHANTSYTVTVTDANGCTSTSDVFIGAEHELPFVNLGPADTGYCEGGSLILNAGGGVASYLWSDSSTGQVLQVSALGLYSVTVTSFAGCTNTDQINVNQVYPLPTPDLGANIIMEAASVVLDAGLYNGYFWNTNASTQTITVVVNGTYTVTVTDANGCEGSDAVNVILWPLGVTGVEGEAAFALYPVPAREVLVLTTPDVRDPRLQLTVTNALGQPVLSSTLTGGGAINEQLKVSHLPRGLYFIQLTGETTRWQRSFTLE